jgi:hypothetical protein
MISVCRPKINTDRMRGGIKVATTVHMIFSTDSLFFTCGETETVHNTDSDTGRAPSLTCSSIALLL